MLGEELVCTVMNTLALYFVTLHIFVFPADILNMIMKTLLNSVVLDQVTCSEDGLGKPSVTPINYFGIYWLISYLRMSI